MPNSYKETNFDERSGIIACVTPWGKWWQTVNEINIEVEVPKGTKAKAIKISLKPRYISLLVSDQLIFEVGYDFYIIVLKICLGTRLGNFQEEGMLFIK